MRARATLAIVAILLTVTACSGGGGSHPAAKTAAKTTSTTGSSSTAAGGNAKPCGTTQSAPARYRHVIWIVMENHRYNAVIDSPDAPYLTGLAAACGSATNQATVGFPSLPNYLGATSGQTYGVADDAPPTTHVLTADNLFRQVRAARGTEKSYQEDMTSACQLTDGGKYAVKHNPAAYYTGADDRTACAADDVPMGTRDAGEFATALDRDQLPTFAFVTPNLCNDTHDCSVSVGDQWLQGWVPRILGSAAYQHGDTALVITYDEYTPLPNVWIAPSVKPGARATESITQYSLLRTTEEMLGLTTFLGGAATAPSLREPFKI
jgi:hypothetical protein